MKTAQKLIQRKNRHKRIRARVIGTAVRPRLVVFRSLKHIYAQLVDDQIGKVLLGVSDVKEFKKGVKTERAKLIGLEVAKKAALQNITSCVFDRNGFKYHGRVKAVAEGAREGGLVF